MVRMYSVMGVLCFSHQRLAFFMESAIFANLLFT